MKIAEIGSWVGFYKSLKSRHTPNNFLFINRPVPTCYRSTPACYRPTPTCNRSTTKPRLKLSNEIKEVQELYIFDTQINPSNTMHFLEELTT